MYVAKGGAEISSESSSEAEPLPLPHSANIDISSFAITVTGWVV